MSTFLAAADGIATADGAKEKSLGVRMADPSPATSGFESGLKSYWESETMLSQAVSSSVREWSIPDPVIGAAGLSLRVDAVLY